MKNAECRIRIGNICLAVTSDYPGFCEHFKRFYGNGSTGVPDFSVKVHIQDRVKRQDITRPLHTFRSQRPFIGEQFSLYDGMIRGHLDLPAGRCTLWVELALLASDYLPLFQDLLFRDLFHHVYRAKAEGRPTKQFIVHGCGVAHRSRGFLFLGPSGSGKSTIAALSNGHAILHDEAVLLSKEDEEYRIESTPYASGFPDLEKTAVPLKAAFFLAHSDTNEILNINRSEAAGRLMQLISPPLQGNAADRRWSTDEILSFSCRAVEAVLFSVLRFTNRNGGFWDDIDRFVG